MAKKPKSTSAASKVRAALWASADTPALALLKPHLSANAATKRRRRRGGRPGHSVNANSLANLRRGNIVAPIERTMPVLTAPAAAEYVKLRASGLPPTDAIQCFTKGERHNRQTLRELAADWESSAFVQTAWDAWNGAQWQDMDEEARLQLAMTHHLAQCAYVLYTTDYTDPDCPLGKLRDAREVIQKYLDDKGGSDEFRTMMKAIVERVTDGGGDGPPKLTASLQIEQISKRPLES